MSARTKIEWCDRTFNGWIGCTKVSQACDHCYAEINTAARALKVKWAPGARRYRTVASNWKHPEDWNKQTFWECKDCGFRGTPKDFDKKHRTCASTQYTVTRQRVFSMSLGDWLDNEVPIEWLVDFLDLVRRTPNLDWLLLTKRSGIWSRRIKAAIDYCDSDDPCELRTWLWAWINGNAPANVWIGATVANQAEADRDVPKLLMVPAAIRFLSIEPMLGPIKLDFLWMLPELSAWYKDGRISGHHQLAGVSKGLDWIVAGAESGSRARPSHPDWFRNLRDQCVPASLPFLFKQWGEWAPVSQVPEQTIDKVYRSNRKAREDQDQDALDESYGRTCTVDMQVMWTDGSLHQLLEPLAFEQGKGAMSMYRIGKRESGRLLDGVEHNAFPNTTDSRSRRQ